MLIEYKIKFEKDGLTIAQRIEPNSSGVAKTANQPAAGVVEVSDTRPADAKAAPLIGAAPNPTDKGGDGGPPGDSGTGGPPGLAQAPIFILGPIVFGGADYSKSVAPAEPAHGGSAPVKIAAAGQSIE